MRYLLLSPQFYSVPEAQPVKGLVSCYTVSEWGWGVTSNPELIAVVLKGAS